MDIKYRPLAKVIEFDPDVDPSTDPEAEQPYFSSKLAVFEKDYSKLFDYIYSSDAEELEAIGSSSPRPIPSYNRHLSNAASILYSRW